MHNFSNVQIESLVGISGKDVIDVLSFSNACGFDERSTKKIIKSVGFKKVRVLPRPYTVSDMCVAGAKEIIEKTRTDVNDIDALIMVTQTPDYLVPATSYGMQEQLHLKDDVLMMDLTQGCSGFLYGLFYGSTLVSSKVCKKVLVCAGDLTYHDGGGKDENEKANNLIFGDGACVALLKYSEDTFSSFSIKSNGEKKDTILNPLSGWRFYRQIGSENMTSSGMHIDGSTLADYVLEVCPQEVNKILAQNKLSKDDISYYLMHQANKTLIKAVSAIAEIPADKIPFLAENTGNASSASIPLAISENLELLPNIKKNKVLMSGFGVGLSTVTAVVDLKDTHLLPAIYM